MTARAQCPVCGRMLTVRSDDRLPRHWWSDREQRAGADRCEGSQMGTRYWPQTETGRGPVRHQRP